MSTSHLYRAYAIKGIKYKSTQYEKKSIIYYAEMVYQKILCPKSSGKNSHFKGQKKRRFRMTPVGSKKCFLDVILHRLKCVDCGHQWLPRPPFMKGKSQMARVFIQFSFDLLSMSTVQDVSRLLGISWNVVKRIHKLNQEESFML